MAQFHDKSITDRERDTGTVSKDRDGMRGRETETIREGEKTERCPCTHTQKACTQIQTQLKLQE